MILFCSSYGYFFRWFENFDCIVKGSISVIIMLSLQVTSTLIGFLMVVSGDEAMPPVFVS